ncbi:MAG: peroxiredoxin [Actinomycetota bacterium]
MAVGVGDPAPAFSLEGVHEGERRTYALADHAGRTIVLVLYPGDDSPVCTRQLTSYTDDLAQFDHVGAQILAVSPQGLDSHEKFASAQGLGFPLLADTDKVLFEAYGSLGPIGFPRRSIFVIDGDGVIRYAHRALAGLGFKRSAELVAAVRDLEAGS